MVVVPRVRVDSGMVVASGVAVQAGETLRIHLPEPREGALCGAVQRADPSEVPDAVRTVTGAKSGVSAPMVRRPRTQQAGRVDVSDARTADVVPPLSPRVTLCLGP